MLLGDRIKPGQSIDGAEVRKLVRQVEAKGFSIPEQSWEQLDAAEKRSLQSASDTKSIAINLPVMKRKATKGGFRCAEDEALYMEFLRIRNDSYKPFRY